MDSLSIAQKPTTNGVAVVVAASTASGSILTEEPPATTFLAVARASANPLWWRRGMGADMRMAVLGT